MDDLCPDRAVPGRLGRGGEVPLGEEVLAARAQPAFAEQALQVGDERSAEPHMRVAPRLEATPAIDVLLAHVHAAGVGDLPVDDGDLAVVR